MDCSNCKIQMEHIEVMNPFPIRSSSTGSEGKYNKGNNIYTCGQCRDRKIENIWASDEEIAKANEYYISNGSMKGFKL